MRYMSITATAFGKAATARIVPFAAFMAFIAVDDVTRLFAAGGLLDLSDTALYYLYPVKTVMAGVLLYFYLSRYQEFSPRDLTRVKQTLACCALGIVTFLLWIHVTWTPGSAAAPAGFNPTLLADPWTRAVLTVFRVAGAVLVVPLMEELFWRSFLLRYLIDADFESVPLGRFTWPSFLTTVLLFGLEHHFILAGMAAGAIYSLILYRTRSLAQCVLAHAVTNLLLAAYVLSTGNWYFW